MLLIKVKMTNITDFENRTPLFEAKISDRLMKNPEFVPEVCRFFAVVIGLVK
jgi:hypothetical protein